MAGRTVYEIPEDYSGTYVLEFSDPTFEGLEVVMGRHSFGAIDAAARLSKIDRQAVEAGELNTDDWGALSVALAEFSAALVSWNLVDRDGKAVGTDLRTVKRLDLIWVMQVFLVWVRALIGIEFEGVDEADLTVETEQ